MPHQEGAFEVDPDDVVEVLLTHVEELSGTDDAGVGNEDVNASVHRDCRRHQLIHLRRNGGTISLSCCTS